MLMCRGLRMRPFIIAVCAAFLTLVAIGNSLAQQSSPTLPSLDQTLKDIFVPGRVHTPNGGATPQQPAESNVDPLASLRRTMQEMSNLPVYQPPAPIPTREQSQQFELQYGPQLGFSLASDKICINGFVFNKADDIRAIESMRYLGGPPRACPRDKIADWVPLSENAYSRLVKAARERVCQPWFGEPPPVCDIFR